MEALVEPILISEGYELNWGLEASENQERVNNEDDQ